MNRLQFLKTNLALASGLALNGAGFLPVQATHPIRLGAPVSGDFKDPADWVKAHKDLGYSAAYCPVQPGADEALVKAYRTEAQKNNILIAEAGVWNNLMDPDEAKRKMNLQKNVDALRLADQIGAHCCVNISGARGEIWDGPYPGNYSADTFDLIVETVRKIIDAVKPVSSYYTLEPMPYMLPDSPDSYLQLIKAVGRKQFAAHLDPVNMISSPQRYYNNSSFLKECFNKLGPYIKSIHAKDIMIMPELTVHLEERRPGLGELDYVTFLREASKLKDVPFMLEHLKTQDDYRLAAAYVREAGKKAGVVFA
ncbi:MAG TPA: sugar phosphate isomerase/epimerase [Bacteroidales bacterium]|nr:sugar phosphate isomerase/epimerase [Bacteroidales bacterium]